LSILLLTLKSRIGKYLIVYWSRLSASRVQKRCRNRISYRLKWQNPSTFQSCWGTLAFILSVAYVNQSLKNWTRSTSLSTCAQVL